MNKKIVTDTNIDNIFSNLFINGNLNITTINKALLHCDNIKNIIKTSTSKKEKSKLLNECIFIINILYKNIGLMMILKNDINTKAIDDRIEMYNNTFFTDESLINAIKKCNNLDNNNLLSKFKITKNKKLSEIQKNIKNITNKIKSNINANIIFQNKSLNSESYYIIQKSTPNANDRNIIEQQYFKKSNNCLDLLAELLYKRYEFANEMGFDTYFEFVNSNSLGQSDDIKFLINDLLKRIESRSKKEINRILKKLKSDGFNKKVDMCDIIYYHDKLKTDYRISPKRVMNVLFKILNKYFYLSIKKINYGSQLWNSNIPTFEVKHNDNTMGYLHIDLKCKQKIKLPFAINLSSKYVDDKITHYPRTAFIANYDNLSKEYLTYVDVVHIFKEFGSAIQSLILYKDNNFDTLFSNIFEYIAWEKSTIFECCRSHEISDHIMFTRYIDFANTIKIQCVNALFDHILHNSKEMISVIKNNSNEITTLYKQLYKDVMHQQEDILNLNINGINPVVILQEINGSEGMLYKNILTSILAFNLYDRIRTKDQKFIKNIFKFGELEKILNDLLSNSETNGYNLYLKELIVYNEIDTEKNINIKKNIDNNMSNHFSSISTNDTSDDSDTIIHIDRSLK